MDHRIKNIIKKYVFNGKVIIICLTAGYIRDK